MISVVLDANILHQEGLSSRNMLLLARLAASGELQVCVPELVQREFVSKRAQDSVEKLQTAKTSIGEVVKKVGGQDPIGKELIELQRQIALLTDQIAPSIADEFDRWAKLTKVVLLKFDPHQITEVLDDYFAGKGAYRRPKSREDIPDAIVSSCILTLLKEVEYVHVVLKDGAFKKHLQSVDRLTVADSLNEFFGLADVQALVHLLDSQMRNVEGLKAFLASTVFRERLSDFLRVAEELFQEVYVEEENIDGVEHLGLDAWGVSVNYAQASTISAITYDQVAYIDQGHFSLAATIKTVADIHYAANYGEYLELPSPRSELVEEISMNGEGVSELRESRSVILHSHVEIVFDPGLTAEQLEIHSQYLKAKEPPAIIELVVDSASIL